MSVERRDKISVPLALLAFVCSVGIAGSGFGFGHMLHEHGWDVAGNIVQGVSVVAILCSLVFLATRIDNGSKMRIVQHHPLSQD